jgi:phospholipid/cholesterol/gamma-HCH transport system ATP-binding protein
MIEFQSVTKTFGTYTVLNNLNLFIESGKITFIVGKSGEGKSVTIKHIMGLLKPTTGRVFVDQQEITELTEEQLMFHRRKIGLLFQHAALFDSMTVGENVMFPLQEHTNMEIPQMLELVEETLTLVGLPGCQHKFPSELSTGEKKRVGLARALVSDPKIMLYDEPTTGMDPLVSEMIDELIVKTNKSRPDLTSIVISHDLKAAMETADKIIMLYKGQVALAGTPDDFRNTDHPVIRQFFAGKVEGPMEFM